MNKFLFLLCEFVGAFLLIFILYNIFIVKHGKNKKKKKMPVDFNVFVKINNVDLKKVDQDKLLKNIVLLDSFDIALVFVFTELTDKLSLKLLIAFVMIIVILYGSYKLYGFILKKKGMTKDDVQS